MSSTETVVVPQVDKQNPYDNVKLASSLVDPDCPCVRSIRQSKCDRPFLSFATCHNRVMINALRVQKYPDLTQCMGHYNRMNKCFDKEGITDRTLVQPPKPKREQQEIINISGFFGSKKDKDETAKLSPVTEDSTK